MDTTGPKLAATLRGRALPGVPVLFISGHVGGHEEEAGFIPAGAAFLGRPITLGVLRRAVGELVA